MEDQRKPREQLVDELAQLRQRVAELEALEAERKRAAEALRESEDRYRDLVEHSHDLICTHDLEGRILSINRTAAAALGYEQSAVLHKDLRDFLAPDVRDQVDAYVDTIQREGVATGLMLVRTSSGAKRIWQYHNTLRTEGVSAPVVRVTAHDITERRQAQEALKQANRELTTLYEMATALGSDLSLDAALQTVAEQITAALSSSGCTLSLWNREENLLETLVDYDVSRPDRTVPPGTPYDLNDYPAARHVLETAHPMLIQHDDPTGDQAQLAWMAEREVLTLLMLPLIARDQVVGLVMLVDDATPRQYAPEEMRLAQGTAAQAGAAIERARLYDQAQQEIARRRRLEKEIEERRLYLESVLASAPDAIVTLDTDQRILEWNPGAQSIFGYSQEEAIGSNLDQLIAAHDPRTLEEATALTRQVLAGRPVPPTEAVRHRKDGTPVDVILAGSPILVGEELVGAVATYRDITQRKRSERALRRYAEQLEALERAAAAVSSTLDVDEVLDSILQQVERVVPGDAFNVMLIEDDAARVVRWRGYESVGVEDRVAALSIPVTGYPNLVKMVHGKEPVVVPDTTADPDWVSLTGWEWLRSYVAAPIEVSGVTIGFLNVDGTSPGQFGFADAEHLQVFASHAAAAIENARLYQELRSHAQLLEQRVQERTAQLQAQYAQLEAILRSTADGVIVTDRHGEILHANPVAEAWFTKTLSAKDAGRLREAVRDLARREEERSERMLPLKGLDLELSAAPVVGEGVEEPRFVVTAHDVSHLRALERMKARFVTNISHELRTPIATVQLYAHLIQQQPERWEEFADALAHEADHQANLVEDIVQISQIDAGRLEMKRRRIPLNQLTDITKVSQETLARDQGVTLEHRPAEPGPVVVVDPEQVTRALRNVVRNALQYTPEGGRVTISTSIQEARDRSWATVAVADTGMGIPQEELPHIFERFFRGEKPRLMQISGTGLGLAIVHEIVQLHGGRVTVESEEGVGTTFTIWLPLARGE